MRVLILTHHLNTGGVETHAATLARQLEQDGHKAVLASEGGLLENGLVMQRIRCYRAEVAPVETDRLCRSAKMLAEIIAAERIDVIHIHHFMPLATGVFAAIQAQRPWVVTSHGVQSPAEWMWHFGAWHYPFCRFALNQAGAVIAVSNGVAATTVRDYSIAAQRIALIENGIDLSRFRQAPLSPGLAGTSEVLRLFYASRLDQDKRQALLSSLHLLTEVIRRGRAAELTIAGEGTIRREIEGAAAAISEAAGKVTFVGARQDMPELMTAHDVVLGVGRVVLEGICTGRPVVLAGVHGVADLITPANYEQWRNSNFSGRGAAPRPVSEVTSALLDLTSDHGTLPDHLSRLRSAVSQSHGVKHICKETVAVYERARKSRCWLSPEARQWWEAADSNTLQRYEQWPAEMLSEDGLLIHSARALAALREDRCEEACQDLRAALEACPGEPHAAEALARLLIDRQQPEGALDVLGTALEVHPQEVRLRYQHGRALLALRRHAEAAASLRRALDYEPQNSNLIGLLSLCEVGVRDAIIADLQKSVTEQSAWARALQKEVATRDQIIADLQQKVAEQSAWAQAQNEAVAERDAIIVNLQRSLAEQSEWAQKLNSEMTARDALILQLQAQRKRSSK